jgi:glycosyltransferase involved in cell wall biosynthesis
MVHGTGSISAYRMARMAKNIKKPILFDNHMIMDVVQKGLLQTIYYKIHSNIFSQYISKNAYKVIGVTDETCTYLETIEKVPNNKIYLLPLGVDMDIFNVSNGQMVKLEKNKRISIVQTGKLNNDKKPQWLALAVIDLLSQGFNVHLKYVGSGDYEIKSYIIKVFKKYGFIDHLTFVDLVPLSELVKVFKKSNFTVFPEGTSLSALEAAACGSVVIMADHPASVAREKNGVGVVYKRGDVNNLSKTIKDLINNKDMYCKIQLLSKESVLKNYSYKNISEDFIKLCEMALSQYNYNTLNKK